MSDDWQEIPHHDDWQEVPVDETQGVSKMESFGRGAAQGSTLGFGDELSAGLESGIIAPIAHGLGLGPDVSYEQALQTNRGQNEAAEKSNPLSYLGGKLTGSIPASVGTGGETILGNTLAGAAQSAATTIGESENQNPTDLAFQAAQSGALGGALTGGTGLLFKGGSNLLSKAPELANEARVASLGPYKGQYKNLLQNDQVQALGQFLKDEKIVSPLASRAKMGERLASSQEKFGTGIGKAVQSADKIAAEQGIPLVSADKLIQESKDEILAPLIKNPFTQRSANEVNKTLESFAATHGGKDLTVDELQVLKKTLRDEKGLFERQGDKATANAYESLYTKLNKAGENQIKEVSGPEEFKDFLRNKLGYGKSLAAGDIAEGRLAGDKANRLFSFSDYASGGASAAGELAHSGNPIGAGITGLAVAGANRFARKYGNQISASVLDKIGDIAKSSPQFLGKYAVPIQKAITRGPSALSATHFTLMSQDPEYREQMKQFQEK